MEQNCLQEAQTIKEGPHRKPVKVFRQGACSACVFFNKGKRENETVELPIVSFAKLYRKNGQLRKSTSLGSEDLAAAIVVLGQAYEWLKSLEQETDGVRMYDD